MKYMDDTKFRNLQAKLEILNQIEDLAAQLNNDGLLESFEIKFNKNTKKLSSQIGFFDAIYASKFTD